MRSYIWKENIARKILVLDDDEQSRKSFQVLIPSFEQFKYDVIAVSSVYEAKEKLKEFEKELCAFLVDQRIGESDDAGIELLSSVTLEYPDIPIVVYTGTRRYEEERAKKNGALLYVPMTEMARNPVMLEIMLNLFGRIRDSQQLRDQFQMIIDTLQDEIAILDPEGRVLMLNKTKKDKFGIKNEEDYYNKECWRVFIDNLCFKLKGRPEQCPSNMVAQNPMLGRATARWHDPSSKDSEDKRIIITACPITDRNNQESVLAIVESVRPLSKIERLSKLIEEIEKLVDRKEKNKEQLDPVLLMKYATEKLKNIMEYPRVRIYLKEFIDGEWYMVCKTSLGMPDDFHKDKVIKWSLNELPKHEEQIIVRIWTTEFLNLSSRAKNNLEEIGNPKSSLVARLMIHDELEGEIVLDYGAGVDMDFDDEDEYVLSVFSRYFAGSLEHILHEQNLSKLDEIDKLLVSATGHDSIMDSIMNKVFELFHPNNCLIRVETNGNYVVKKAIIEGKESNAGHSIIPKSIGISGKAISEKGAQFVLDVKKDSEFIGFDEYMIDKKDSQWMRRREEIKSVIIGVLLHSEEVIGTITLEFYNKKDFSFKEKQLFRRFCNKAAIALFRVDELSRAIQNTGQIISMIGSALNHELNSLSFPLQIIVSNLENIIQKKEGAEISQETLDQLNELSLKLWEMVDLIKGLPEHRDINDICKDVIGICAGTSRKYLVEFKPDERIPKIETMEKAVSIIFTLLNLISNSSDAMKKSPKESHVLKISTLYEPENWRMILTVEDNGEGIPEPIRSRIFEPGFSTKGQGGMGLYLVRILIENLGGRVEFNTNEKEYTIFKVFIPWEEVNEDEE